MIYTEHRKLTKADLLKGKDAAHEIFFEELGGTLTLHPLTSAQWAETQAIQISKIIIGGKAAELKQQDTSGMEVKVPMEELTKAQFEANVYAVKCSLGADWTVEEVSSLTPAGIVDKIAAKVLEISGVTADAADIMKAFRKDSRGAAGSGVKPERVSAGKKSG